jgi:hypothetical protein
MREVLKQIVGLLTYVRRYQCLVMLEAIENIETRGTFAKVTITPLDSTANIEKYEKKKKKIFVALSSQQEMKIA